MLTSVTSDSVTNRKSDPEHPWVPTDRQHIGFHLCLLNRQSGYLLKKQKNAIIIASSRRLLMRTKGKGHLSYRCNLTFDLWSSLCHNLCGFFRRKRRALITVFWNTTKDPSPHMSQQITDQSLIKLLMSARQHYQSINHWMTSMSIATVIGPTPPGTGVMNPALWLADA